MKIALIGEFSGVHQGLKAGLEKLGHHVDIYSSGDGFKRIKYDKKLYPERMGFIQKIFYILIGVPWVLRLISKKYDVVQIINPHVFYSPAGNEAYYKWLMNLLNSRKIVLSMAVVGCESNTQKGLSALERSPCPGCLNELGVKVCPLISRKNKSLTKIAVNSVDHIIPFGGPSYWRSYSDDSKCRDIVPFPVDLNFIDHRDNQVGKKIKILHGINRPGFKGSNVIIEALRALEFNYPDFFDIIIPERVPFDDYIQLLLEANIVVDQLYGDGLGMNALYAMSASCVVFTSYDRVEVGGLKLINSPAIPLESNKESIYRQLEELLKWTPDMFLSRGNASRKFVLDYCSPELIAKDVLNHWQEY